MLTVSALLIFGLVDDDTQRLDQPLLGIIEVRQRDWEIKDVDEFVSFVLDGFREVDEVLVHDECFLHFGHVESWESLQNLSDVVVVDSIDFH